MDFGVAPARIVMRLSPQPSLPKMHRRAAIASAIGMLIVPGIARSREDADDLEIERVRTQAKAVGLGNFGVSRNERYQAIGDAPESFRQRALEILLGISRDYLQHFTFRKFDVAKPNGRMTVVVLADRAGFGAFLGEDPGNRVGGMYSPMSNELLLFDNRTEGKNPLAERLNTVVLTHEAMHQLTYSTGLLRRGGDVPLAIAEGLANYAEVRSPNGRPPIGEVNRPRLVGLITKERNGRHKLPPIASLIGDDSRLEAEATEQMAYSEAWLLIHYLLKTPKMQPKFKAYLKAIASRNDATKRMDDWREHLGEDAPFDRDLANYLRKL